MLPSFEEEACEPQEPTGTELRQEVEEAGSYSADRVSIGLCHRFCRQFVAVSPVWLHKCD